MRSLTKRFVGLGLVVLLCTGTALAQPVSSRHGVGPYFGFGADPDQFIVGGQGIFGLSGSRVHFSPSMDFGIGDEINAVTLNFDVTYDFLPASSRVAFYAGAGPTLAFLSSDRYDDDTEAGLSLVTGVKLPGKTGNSFNIGLRAGLGDIPEMRMTAAYIFNMR